MGYRADNPKFGQKKDIRDALDRVKGALEAEADALRRRPLDEIQTGPHSSEFRNHAGNIVGTAIYKQQPNIDMSECHGNVEARLKTILARTPLAKKGVRLEVPNIVYDIPGAAREETSLRIHCNNGRLTQDEAEGLATLLGDLCNRPVTCVPSADRHGRTHYSLDGVSMAEIEALSAVKTTVGNHLATKAFGSDRSHNR